MARRRRNDAKATKSDQKFIAVRKSSRQIAKKQQQEQKVNGDIIQSSSNNSDDSKDDHDEAEEKLINSKLVSDVQKKLHKCRSSISCEETISSNDVIKSKVSLKEEDRQIEIEPILAQSKKEKNSKNLLPCLSVPTDESRNSSTLQEMWSEDVNEETIICEEMDVEEIVTGEDSQNNRVVVEQVLVVNEPQFDSKSIVEFTVIQNEDGTESMLMTSEVENLAQEDGKHENVSQGIEKGVRGLQMNDLNNLTEPKSTFLLKANENKSHIEFESNIIEENAEEIQSSDCNDFNLIKSSSNALNFENRGIEEHAVNIPPLNVLDSLHNSSDENNCSMQLLGDSCFNESTEKYVENLQESEIFTDSSSEQNSSEKLILTKKTSLLKNDDKIIALNKMEQLKIHDQMSCNSIPEDDTKNIAEIIVGDDEMCAQKTDSRQFKNENVTKILNRSCIEEYSRGGVIDTKQETEDVKLSSSSENSSDTNSYKFTDLISGSKNTQDFSEEDKKNGFRCRSGSIDTNLESRFNNSGVRRSTRIRTIGLLKQRYSVKCSLFV